NFVLLSDGDNINILVLEPILKDIPKNGKSDATGLTDDSGDEDDIFDQINNNIDNQLKKTGKTGATTKEPEAPQDIFTYINLVLYTFPVGGESSHLKKEQDEHSDQI